MTNRFAALLLLCAAALSAQDQPKPPVDKPPAAPPTSDASAEKEKEKPKWDVAKPAVRLRRHGGPRRRHGHLDVRRRLAGRQGDRLRPPRRPLHDARSGGGRGAAADLRDSLGHAAPLLARRQVDRVHLRPLRRRQHLDHGPRRQEPAAGHQGDLPPAQQPGLDARLAVHRRPQALHRNALGRRGRDLALPPHRRRRPADDQAGDRAEGRRASRRSRPTAATSTGPRTPRPESSSSTTRTPTTQIYVIKRLDRADGQDHQLRHRPGRLDPSHAVARRQVARLHPPRPLQVDALRQGPRVGRRAADLGRPRARHAGDLGDPRRLPGHGVDAGLEVGRVLGRRQDPAGSTSRRSSEAAATHVIPFRVKDTRKAATGRALRRRRADRV